MAAKKALKIILWILLLVCYGISFSKLHDLRGNLPPETKRAQALAIDPTLLKVISGPFQGLVADYLNLKASIFMGGAFDVTEEDWEAVYTLLKQSLYLDPYFFQSGYYIQGLLSWRKGMHEKANDLLKYHAEHRYWDWEPMFYVGFNSFYYLNDVESAALYMQKASERPNAQPIAASLSARLSHKAGHTLTAIALLKTMYESAKEERLKEYYGKRLEAQLGAYQLEQAVDQFKKREGHYPSELSELTAAGILEEVPANPFNTPYQYDPDSGKVTFDETR